MTFSRYLLMAMIALSAFFVYLLQIFEAANEIKALRAQQGQVSYQDYQAVIDKLAIDFTQRIAHSDAATI